MIIFLMVLIVIGTTVGYIIGSSKSNSNSNTPVTVERNVSLGSAGSLTLEKNPSDVNVPSPKSDTADRDEEAYNLKAAIAEAYPDTLLETHTNEDSSITVKLHHADGNVTAKGGTNTHDAITKLAKTLGVSVAT